MPFTFHWESIVDLNTGSGLPISLNTYVNIGTIAQAEGAPDLLHLLQPLPAPDVSLHRVFAVGLALMIVISRSGSEILTANGWTPHHSRTTSSL